jgi:hypothetical protein
MNAIHHGVTLTSGQRRALRIARGVPEFHFEKLSGKNADRHHLSLTRRAAIRTNPSGVILRLWAGGEIDVIVHATVFRHEWINECELGNSATEAVFDDRGLAVHFPLAGSEMRSPRRYEDRAVSRFSSGHVASVADRQREAGTVL